MDLVRSRLRLPRFRRDGAGRPGVPVLVDRGILPGMAGRVRLTAAFSCEPAVRVRDRVFGPAALGGAAGVLDASAGEPKLGWPGGSQPGLAGGCGVMRAPLPGWSGVAGPLAAVILRVCPGLAGRGAWGSPRQVRAGSITTTSAPPCRLPGVGCQRGRGQTTKRPRPAGPAAHAAGLVAQRTRPSRMA